MPEMTLEYILKQNEIDGQIEIVYYTAQNKKT